MKICVSPFLSYLKVSPSFKPHAVHSVLLVYNVYINIDASLIPFFTSKLFISVTRYRCDVLSSVFLDFLIVSVAGSPHILVIHSGLCVKMNDSCMIHPSNRYSDQLNLRAGLILTKQDYSQCQRLLV